MNALEMLQIFKEVITEVKVKMEDDRPEIEIAAQFGAAGMFERLDKRYKFKTLP